LIVQNGDTPINPNADGGDEIAGLDCFGRVIEQNQYNGDDSFDCYQCGYDAVSDVWHKGNCVGRC
jgi:hypothetical protein